MSIVVFGLYLFLKRNLKRIFVVTFLSILSIFINRVILVWRYIVLETFWLYIVSLSIDFKVVGFPVNKNRCSIFYPCITTFKLKVYNSYGGCV